MALDVLTHLGAPGVLACPEGPLAAAARAAGVPVLALPERPLAARGSARRGLRAACGVLAHAREARRLARDLDAATVVGWGARSALATALVAPGPRRVVQHHDLPTSRALATLLRAAGGRVDLVLAPSRVVATAVGGRVLPLGVDLARFRPREGGERRPTVLFLGALVDWKRPDLALETVARVPGVRLVLAGAPLPGDPEGPALEARLRARARRPDLAGRVELRGAVPDPAAVLSEADALLHPAEREAFGLAVAEAMACGLPVAAARAGALPELVGDTGALFTPGDPTDAARALCAALTDPGLGPRARRRAEATLDVRTTRARYRSAFAARAPDPRAGEGIALVAVSHDSAPELGRLLASSARHLPGARVVVADSGSTDASATVARAAGAHVLELGQNVGFGRATNAALAEVHEPVCLLVNPDVELVDASLAALARAVGSGPERILAPVLLRSDGHREASAHPAPLSPAALALALAPARLLPGALRDRIEPFRSDRPRRVAWAVGACLAARTSTFRRLGPFDPAIFLYGEDLDLGLRAAQAGVPTVLWPGARVLHTGGTSSRRAFGGEPVDRLVEARRRVLIQHRGALAARADLAVQALTFADRALLKRLLSRPATRERAYLRALLGL